MKGISRIGENHPQGPRPFGTFLTSLFLVLAAALGDAAPARTIVTWDFSQGRHGWIGNRYVEGLRVTGDGLAFNSTGIDPWIESRPVDLPGGGVTRVRLRMRSDADASAELFYGPRFEAGRSARFTVQHDGRWHEYTLIIKAPLGAGTRFRLDPAAGPGHVVVGSIAVETLPEMEPPRWDRPQRPAKGTAEPLTVRSKGLVVEHCRGGWGQFVVKTDDAEMASGYQADLIGLVFDDQPYWLGLREADVTVEQDDGIVCRASLEDRDGAQWRAIRRFQKGPQAETITIETTFVVDKDRRVVHLPWLTLFPGLGTFGRQKTQGLLAGLEYLADEPSSSEADITTPEHVRRVPDPVKIAFPLMAIAQDGHYIGLIWEPSDRVAPVFDSPDRVYRSDAHVMALTAPAIGEMRFENDLIAHTPFEIKAHQPLKTRVTVLGGRGETVVPAIKKYVALEGLPDLPQPEGGFDAAVKLLAHGWLDSAINEGGVFRHAVWGDAFRAGPAGDAPMYIDWLANVAEDADLTARLVQARDLAVTKMPPGRPYISTVSHTRTPAAPFVFGGLYPYVQQRCAQAGNALGQFDERGVKRYRPGKVDYGRTHFADHANGHAALDVALALEAATLSADPDLIERGLELLDRQTALYARTVPRGAQVWEVPLHTPDVLASAYLVRAYTLGYLISGRREHLDQARYWAWTGVPFVYLVNPTDGAVGPYATIAVLGATNWKAPSWFGRPVQWCGLVYASALHLLSAYDPQGPWDTIAKGITAAGLQMTWPVTDEKRQGLLPDFFHLRAQLSDGPAINPGTVQAHVPELYGKGKLYDVRKLAGKNTFIHAPCAIRHVRQQPQSLTFVADGWGNKTCYVLIAGLESRPQDVRIRTYRPGPVVASPFRQAVVNYQDDQSLLAITIAGPSEVRIRY